MTSHRMVPSPARATGVAGQRLAMGVGRRGFLLLAIGLVWMAPAWIEPRTVWLMLVWDALVVAVWIADLRRLPLPAQLTAERAWGGPLALGESGVVSITLHVAGPGSGASSSPAIDATLIDAPPASLRVARPQVDVRADVQESGRAEYDVTPSERGDQRLGAVLARYTSGWNIAVRWATFPLEQTVRVYPNLHDARKHALRLVRSRQLAMEKRRARQRGHGRELESLRDYRDGDEPRDICWTATARRGRLVTREYTPERSQAIWILVDAGRLLRAQVGRHSKLDHAVNAALSLAQVAMGSGDRVGLLTYGRRPLQRLAPDRGPLHLRALVEALAMTRAEPYEADHATAAGTVLAMQKQRALIVWLTDVAETAGIPDVVESSQHMAPRHVVLLAVTRHPALADAAAARPADSAEIYRVMAAQETLERRELLLHGLRQRGVSTLEMQPGALSAALVDRYLAIKEQSLI